MRAWIRLGYAVLLGVATGELAANSLRRHDKLLLVMVVIVATAAAIQIWFSAAPILGLGRHTERGKEIDQILRTRLIQHYEDGFFSDCIMSVSLHVWEIPTWYRRTFRYPLRRKLVRYLNRFGLGRKIVNLISLKPKLVRVGYQEFNRKASLGIPFRKGYGLIGRCLQENSSDVLVTNFRNPILAGKLRQGKLAWQSAARGHGQLYEAHRLQYEDALELSKRYSQAAALVIINRETNEPVGCITLSLPLQTAMDLETSKKALLELKTTRDLVEPLVSNTKTW